MIIMAVARAFRKDRDATLRSLDRDRLDRFLRERNQPRPSEWIGDAWLASMHKARLRIDAFTEAEKAVSRRWLAQHGYTEAIGGAGPCPSCGGTDPSNSDCPVCGVSDPLH
jgi:hypothetical protein